MNCMDAFGNADYVVKKNWCVKCEVWNDHNKERDTITQSCRKLLAVQTERGTWDYKYICLDSLVRSFQLFLVIFQICIYKGIRREKQSSTGDIYIYDIIPNEKITWKKEKLLTLFLSFKLWNVTAAWKSKRKCGFNILFTHSAIPALAFEIKYRNRGKRGKNLLHDLSPYFSRAILRQNEIGKGTN